ncbi:MAG: hypothetical protein J5956_11605 [Ruminococcus sp.]|nr:hypothetical protein [Ruminococcus sp.]
MLRNYKIVFKKIVQVESFSYTVKASNKEEAEARAKKLFSELDRYGDDMDCTKNVGNPTIEVTPINEKQAASCIEV